MKNNSLFNLKFNRAQTCKVNHFSSTFTNKEKNSDFGY
jgi:hypothetical protein